MGSKGAGALVERATIDYLRKLDHDVEWLGDVPELGLGADDETIVTYASRSWL